MDNRRIAVIGGHKEGAADLMRAMDKAGFSLTKTRYDLIANEAKRQDIIRKNTCPTCGSKLIRGIRDKKNGYKRKWTCSNPSNCGDIHHI